ncbi:Uracil phosphoribosyltransferase [Camellia lanceoleosa]|uniref:Uracil phosphoribosyltransferase n=1 Tax=Camellia lanceoleosa TaxID=1840588 RepID=A0ACC0IWT3_9ERIC|nr:Uracil phosphoribosyltransferase [Camellia lanceoleosa]
MCKSTNKLEEDKNPRGVESNIKTQKRFVVLQKIKNPNYKGKWKTPWIDNPEFEDDPHLYVLKPIKYVGIEVWQIEKDAFEEVEKARRAKEEEWRWDSVCLQSSEQQENAMAELGRLLMYEASRDWLPTIRGEIQSPMGVASVEFIDPREPVAEVPHNTFVAS